MVDETRFRGDDTIRAYNGEDKDFLVYVQESLRIFIQCEVAYPKATDFEKTVKIIFERKAQEVVKAQSENKLLLDLPM